MEQQRETLLIVDDSRLQRAVLNEIFSSNFNILEVSSGEECLKMIEEKQDMIDLVLLDLVMSGMDGFDVLKHRQGMPEFKKIPVVVLTTTDTPEVQTKAFELGASDFISKPAEPAIARLRIGNILKTNRRLNNILQKREELRIRSEVDEMTHLLNKTTAEHTISHILLSSPEGLHALFAIDIDNFKAVNDICGHKMGDHTISVVAGILASHFSGSDIVGRIGGDEFVVFVRNITTKEAIYEKAQELLNAISDKEGLSIPEKCYDQHRYCFHRSIRNVLYHTFSESRYCTQQLKKIRETMFFRIWGFFASIRCHAEKYFIIYTVQECRIHVEVRSFLSGQACKNIFPC